MPRYRSTAMALAQKSAWFRAALLSFLVIGGLSSHATRLKADTIFSSIVGNCCGGYGISGTNSFPGSESVAEAFTPSANYVMTDAQVEVFQVLGFGGDPFFNVSLFSNVGGLPGSLIGTIGSDLVAPAGGGLVVASGPMPVLASGISYWIVLTPFDSKTDVGWEMARGLPDTIVAFTSSSTGQGGWGSGNSVPVQFQVDGTPTPEPASVILAGTGFITLMGLFLLSKRPQSG
jgi:hypothetical protein